MFLEPVAPEGGTVTGGDLAQTAAELAALPSGAAQVRAVVEELGPDANTGEVCTVLAQYGITLAESTVRSALKRLRRERVTT
jgi:alkylated DNA nucleotide flippase Atl1